MRFLIAPEYYQEMLERTDHTPDCYVRPGQYLHHLYVDGVKYAVAQAVSQCLQDAIAKCDADAVRHLQLHQSHYDVLANQVLHDGRSLNDLQMLGDPPPAEVSDDDAPKRINRYEPQCPKVASETGLSTSFLFEMILRAIYNRGRITGTDISNEIKLNYSVLAPLLPMMRKQSLIDIVGQKGQGDASYEYEIKPPKGPLALQDALAKTSYSGPCPVPFEDYVESVAAQTIKNLVVTRRSIQRAFQDLVITPSVFNEIGPAINSAASIFLFGYPGNGKTSLAERITRLMGDDIFIPYAVEANGAIIKLYDPIVHQIVEGPRDDGIESMFLKEVTWDERYARIKRPTIVTGGELTMQMLDLKYNPIGKFYEAPLQMKSNGGIFMIDDFGRQQVRAMDLLNRWIVPLEKRYDYLTTITGNKIEVPFDELLIFSTNLDPTQLADEAFLRRIKFKIEVRDPDEHQWRQIWRLVCRSRKVEYDDEGIDYLVEKWYKPTGRPMRMCQPRDILDQMISIGKYNMERVTFTPDLIDAGCATYFVSNEKKDFGAKVRLD
ncbi:MAG: ATP-binding protein [Gemmataceae bacterium]